MGLTFVFSHIALQERMIPRNCAAAALIGWVLLLAPSKDHKMRVDAPLNEWKQSATYDTSMDCEGARKQIVAVATAVGSNAPPGSVWAMCLAGDDPRLNKK
jgi:hypothetical protein